MAELSAARLPPATRIFPLAVDGYFRIIPLMLEKVAKEQLKDLAERFCRAEGISPAALGKRSLNDNTFFARLDGGATFTFRTFDRLVRWLSDHWPTAEPWPDAVARPEAGRGDHGAPVVASPFPTEAEA